MRKMVLVAISLVLCLSAATVPVAASDWPFWRGPDQTGVSSETGLITSWSPEGKNLIWHRDFIGRSTPVIMNGRVFVNGRTGEGIDRQGVVTAFDAETGELLWERRINVYLTTVPFNRVGWASLTGDPETGYIYHQGANGSFYCFDRDGEVVWHHSFKEEFGRFEGYGGRTASPVVDEDRVIVSMINGSWGNQGPPRQRYYAFDKRTGEVVWMTSTDGLPADRNTQSTPVVAVIGGQRLVIAGGSNGRVQALQSRTGKVVWEFELSKRGINVSPVVSGDTVFIGHSEENVDEGTLGRVVAIDGTGSGDVTATHERWRSNELRVGFPSPLVHEDRLYVIDNSGNLTALDVESGEQLWQESIGTVGKASPVWADGRIYATETNGRVSIVEPGESSARVLDYRHVEMPDGSRYAETYGSPAIAYGRVYFTTEAGVFCLGDPKADFKVTPSRMTPLAPEPAATGSVASLLVVPAEVLSSAGAAVDFEVRAFDEAGRALGTVDAEWELEGLRGDLSAGHLAFAGDAGFQAGMVVAKSSGLEARARVRVFPPLPWHEDFDAIPVGGRRGYWIGAGRYQVEAGETGNVLVKPVADSGLLRSNLVLGPPNLSNYTIQADVMATQNGRRRSDGGLINSGYILDLMSIHQQLQLRSWSAALRVQVDQPFEIEMDKWYTAKLRVENDASEATISGKVWPRGEPEPEAWTVTATDPHPVLQGAPALQAYSPSKFFFDNLLVTGN